MVWRNGVVVGTAVNRTSSGGLSGANLEQEYNDLETSEYRWRLDNSIASWPGADTFPDEYTDHENRPRFEIRSRVLGSGGGSWISEGGMRAACEITEIERLDGSKYTPSNPSVGDGATPTPTPCLPGQLCWANWDLNIPINVTPIAPVSNTVEFGVGVPGTPECVTIVPGRHISETVFGYDIDAGWNNYEVCTQPVEVQAELLDMDFAFYAFAAVGVMGLGAIYKFFRTG
jgi:hypothetical protein